MPTEGRIDVLQSPEYKLREDVARLIQENEKLKAELERAGIDGLTGLLLPKFLEPNLQKIVEELNLDNDRRVSGHKEGVLVLFFDIDDFKKFNDSYGHDVGNAVLSMVGGQAKKVLFRPGDSAYRYGGEEIVLVLVLDQDFSEEEIEDLVKKKQKAVSSLKVTAENIETKKEETVPIMLSAGFAFKKRGDVTFGVGDLLKTADHRMIADKKTKGDRRKEAEIA